MLYQVQDQAKPQFVPYYHELRNKSYNNIKLFKVVSSPVTFAIINEEFKLNKRNVKVFNGVV